MPKLRRGKAGFYAVVDEDLLERFKTAVAIRYGAGKGMFSKAVSEALEMWLHAHTQRPVHGGNALNRDNGMKSRTMKNVNEIRRVLEEEDRVELWDTELAEIITQVVGGDRRTIRRYTNLLLRLGIIEFVTIKHGHRLFRFKNPKLAERVA